MSPIVCAVSAAATCADDDAKSSSETRSKMAREVHLDGGVNEIMDGVAHNLATGKQFRGNRPQAPIRSRQLPVIAKCNTFPSLCLSRNRADGRTDVANDGSHGIGKAVSVLDLTFRCSPRVLIRCGSRSWTLNRS